MVGGIVDCGPNRELRSVCRQLDVVESEQPPSSDEESDYFSAEEDFDAPTHQTSDFGVPSAGDVVIGGRWTRLQELPDFGSQFRAGGDSAVGWDQPDPKEVLPMTEDEVRDCQRLMHAVGEQGWRSLPADLQLAFVRDVYGNPEGVGWKPQDAFENTVPVMQSCIKWAKEIGAFEIHCGPQLPNEDRFKEYAPYAFSGADRWGHPRIWAMVTGWPPIDQEVRRNFSASEVYMLHTKRFLEFQQLKRERSAQLQRPIALHCCVLAFGHNTSISVPNIRWLFDALQYQSVSADDPQQPAFYTTDQWFFPMTLNAPAIIVNTPLRWRAAYSMAKRFMVEETAAKFVLVGSDFLPILRDHGVAYQDIPSWILELHKGETIVW